MERDKWYLIAHRSRLFEVLVRSLGELRTALVACKGVGSLSAEEEYGLERITDQLTMLVAPDVWGVATEQLHNHGRVG